MMTILKNISTGVLMLIFVQLFTFYTISESYLIDVLGENHESYVLNYGNNAFKDIEFLTELDLTSEQIKESFKDFKDYDIRICEVMSDCSGQRKSEDFYLYMLDIEREGPLFVNIIIEGEMAKEFGACWHSKYIWVLYKWILIEKKNTGIS